ncbi:DsrE/DsrF/TusD sulfur relay family protein [Propionivibrio sp.]|uniref:DsrE/DsrF/TusD sulfur relay family protein n=1 Tax=Propionivibrio sp. TaxID=2212460 RepID=UPI003BF3C71B
MLILVHAPAYGSERVLSALRLATAIAGQESETVDLRLFMMSDAVTVGLPNQIGAEAGSSLQLMLENLVQHGAQIRLCRSCAQARGIVDLVLIPGVSIGTLPELADWTLAADKVITF